jgi:hypothetical protein
MPITKASGNSVTAAAKGDLVVGNATNDSGVLSVGANNTVLTADSSTATGLKWASISSAAVVQIVSSSTTTATTIASTTFTDTGITASITPTSASNKIIVLCNVHYYHYAATVESMLKGRLVRGSTTIANFDNELNQLQAGGVTYITGRGNAPIIWLDSPATTSSTTYKVQGGVGNTASSGTATYQFNSLPSSIILMEVVA